MKHWGAILGSLTSLLLIAGVVVVALSDNAFGIVDDGTSEAFAYIAIAGFIFGDAIVPVLPGETVLNAGAVLAAAGDLSLPLVILAGAVGAIAGDNALYWIANRTSHRFDAQIEKLEANKRVQTLVTMLGNRPGLFIVFGRYVPGVRFFINATMGIENVHYPTFLLWSSIGGAVWATYTAVLAYLVGTALDDYPLRSIVASGGITTVLIIALFWWQARDAGSAAGDATPEPASPS